MGLDYSLFKELVYPELWFVNNLALKASRDLVYEAIAESAGLTYNADLEVFFNEEGQVVISAPIGNEKGDERMSISSDYSVAKKYLKIDYFGAVMTVAKNKY